MKATIYIFGNFSDGYSQYLDDNTRQVFTSISNNRISATEVIYHREGALSYYIYTREISKKDNTFIGLCYVFNDILISDFSYLYDIFEDTITNIVVTGEILEFNSDGSLTTKVSQLYSHDKELQRISDYMNSKLSSLGQYASKLPPVNFSISNSESKTFDYNDIVEAKKAIKDYSNIRVVKGDYYDTEALKGYSSKLKAQNAKIQSQDQTISNLKDEVGKLKRQKKQITLVVILFIVIAMGVLIFAIKINSKNEVILRKDNQIDNLTIHVNKLQTDSINLTNELYISEQNLSSTKSRLDKLCIDYGSLQEEKNELYNLSESQKETIESLRRNIDNLNQKLNKSNSYSRNTTSLYKIWAESGTRAYTYYQCGSQYIKTDCYYSDNQIVEVYTTRDGYALTLGGYVRLRDLKKQ